MNWNKYKPENFEYRGQWIVNWFSNFSLCPFIDNNILYNSVENYYQAHKTVDSNKHREIASMTPSQAKKAGRRLSGDHKLREDWENVKYEVMKNGLRFKFNQPEWKEKLLNSEEIIIEWNNWGDKIWGVTLKDGKGENLLGKCLMEIKEEIKKPSV